MSEKLVTMFGLIFVVSYVAKYVGTTIFGQIALATSLFQITLVIAQLGSDVIIFKRISKNHKSGVKLITATLPMRGLIYILISIPVVFFTHKTGDVNGFIFIIACFASCFFSSIDVFSMYYDAKLESMRNTIANIFGLIVSLILRWVIVFFHVDVKFLAIPIIFASLIPFLIRLYFFKRHNSMKVGSSRHRNKYKKYLIMSGFSFVISTLSVAIYARLSIILLGFMSSGPSVGVFSVSITLAGAWSFILTSLITSNLPSIFSEKDELKAIKLASKLNAMIVIISLIIISFVSIFGDYFIRKLYGIDFIDAYKPLLILSFSTMISSLGIISARFIARSSGYSFLSKKMLCVALFSLVINIPLINFYGLTGAATATLLTEIVSLTFFNYFFKKGIILKLHLSTLFVNKILK